MIHFTYWVDYMWRVRHHRLWKTCLSCWLRPWSLLTCWSQICWLSAWVWLIGLKCFFFTLLVITECSLLDSGFSDSVYFIHSISPPGLISRLMCDVTQHHHHIFGDFINVLLPAKCLSEYFPLINYSWSLWDQGSQESQMNHISFKEHKLGF